MEGNQPCLQVKDKGDQGYRVPNVFGHSRRRGYCRRGWVRGSPWGLEVGTEVVWPKNKYVL